MLKHNDWEQWKQGAVLEYILTSEKDDWALPPLLRIDPSISRYLPRVLQGFGTADVENAKKEEDEYLSANPGMGNKGKKHRNHRSENDRVINHEGGRGGRGDSSDRGNGGDSNERGNRGNRDDWGDGDRGERGERYDRSRR